MSSSQNTSYCFSGGTIYTADPSNPFCECVVTNGEKIVYAGSKIQAKEYCSASTEYIDLKKRLLLPGFIDSHIHTAWGGNYLSGIDLSEVKSREQFRAIVSAHLENSGKRWITGGNWNHHNWSPSVYPHKNWIDDLTPDIPLLIHRCDYHIALANSKALAIAGIDKNTPSPAGGEIEKDESGLPTGIVKDSAIELVRRHIPAFTPIELKNNFLRLIEHASQHGITSLQDIAEPEHIPVFYELLDEHNLNCRVSIRLPLNEKNIQSHDKYFRSQDQSFIKFGGLKAFADGSLGASTAKFFEPYSDDRRNSGLFTDHVLTGALITDAFNAHNACIQLSIHAIGDEANHYVLDLLESLIFSQTVGQMRHRIEHAQHLLLEDIPRFAAMGCIVSGQPRHLFDDGSWLEEKIGVERAKTSYAFRSMIDAGALVCFGSDFPVTSIAPLMGISSGVTRKTKSDKMPSGFQPQEKISVEAAIRCYTTNAAYASFSENETGMLKAGLFADMAIIDRDIFHIPAEEIENASVALTMVNGHIAYQK